MNLGRALLFAALLGRLQTVQTLLENGAKVVMIKTRAMLKRLF